MHQSRIYFALGTIIKQVAVAHGLVFHSEAGSPKTWLKYSN